MTSLSLFSSCSSDQIVTIYSTFCLSFFCYFTQSSFPVYGRLPSYHFCNIVIVLWYIFCCLRRLKLLHHQIISSSLTSNCVCSLQDSVTVQDTESIFWMFEGDHQAYSCASHNQTRQYELWVIVLARSDNTNKNYEIVIFF